MRIKQLSKNLINQIAAGEVIERPMSVVKELVENSIDANATKISIEISNECRNIRIADNGSGIHPDDLFLAFSKHATSKLQNDEDLYAIKTLGFRGEALSSIISISKVTCTTRTKSFDSGFKIECQDSEVQKTETGCAIGTIMNVQDLFYNIPARLKFLKNAKTEFSYIQELVQSLAIINPNIAFELKNEGKIFLKTDGLDNLLNTIKDVYNKDLTEQLKEVFKTDKLSNLKISGYITTPNYTRSSKKGYHIYINSRTVKCPVFLKAIANAYKNTLPSGKFPFVVLNLEIPAEDVDVNVHPTKKEVRYQNTNQIFGFIYAAVDMALSNYSEKPVENEPERTISDFSEFKFKKDSENFCIENIKPLKPIELHPIRNISQKNYSENMQQKILYPPANESEKTDEKIIGQYAKTYILIEKNDGLEIVDQHIADERYIYEKLKVQKEIASQILFISDVIEVMPTEADMIRNNKEKFEHFGYDIEILSETEITFKKIPQLLSKVSPKEILADILENFDGNIEGLEEKILITTSCKAAIKANQELSLWQMEELIKKWRKCEKPYTCPHGRNISKTIPHKDIAGFFGRQK